MNELDCIWNLEEQARQLPEGKAKDLLLKWMQLEYESSTMEEPITEFFYRTNLRYLLKKWDRTEEETIRDLNILINHINRLAQNKNRRK